MMADGGVDVTEVSLPGAVDHLVEASIGIVKHEMARQLSKEYRFHRAELLPILVDTIEDGLRIDHETYRSFLDLAGRCRRLMGGVFEGHDVILTPATLGEAPRIETTGDPCSVGPGRCWAIRP
jgi:Asp-tRNA(Asn)/Glu-tRNA(Gln) amidotransferase A subunit family amidase